MSERRENVFRLGDRVRYRLAPDGRGCVDIDGAEGTVVYIDKSACPYTVRLDRYYMGAVPEERAGHYSIPNCWFCAVEHLEKI